MNSFLEAVARAFGDEPRPEHFTNYRHCCECAEHDETLRAHTPETIGLEELGKPSWDPICFATDEAYRYYMPGLARLALGRGTDWYLDQFLFHLNEDRVDTFTSEQRAAVLGLLDHMLDTMSEEAEANNDIHTLRNRIALLTA